VCVDTGLAAVSNDTMMGRFSLEGSQVLGSGVAVDPAGFD